MQWVAQEEILAMGRWAILRMKKFLETRPLLEDVKEGHASDSLDEYIQPSFTEIERVLAHEEVDMGERKTSVEISTIQSEKVSNKMGRFGVSRYNMGV